MNFIKEFVEFIIIRKKYWLLPVMLALTLFGGLIMLGQGSSLAPWIYAIF